MNVYDLREEARRLGVPVRVFYQEPVPAGVQFAVVFANVPGQTVGHWVAIDRAGIIVVLMDPYGFHNGERYVIPYFDEDEIEHFLFNPVQGQRFGTLFCGLYCLAYFKLRNDGLNPAEAIQNLFPVVDGSGNHKRLAEVVGVDPVKVIAKYNR